MRWNVDFGERVRSVTFAVDDAMDMKWSTGFRVSALDAIWDLDPGQPNGNRHWLTIAFDKAVRRAAILFESFGLQPGTAQSGDGFGISGASVCLPHGRG